MNINTAKHNTVYKKSLLQKPIVSILHPFVVEKLKNTSPVLLGMVIFSIIYIGKCTNDSNLDGVEYFNMGEYDKALKSYNEFLLLEPHDIKTLYNRGRCYEMLGDDIKAEADYQEVLDRESFHVNALLGMSQIYYRKNDFQTTINLAETAAAADTENYLAHYYAGRAYHKIGYWMSALKCYNRVIELSPDYGNAFFHRSSVMLSIGLMPLGCHDLQTAKTLGVEGADEALKKYCNN